MRLRDMGSRQVILALLGGFFAALGPAAAEPLNIRIEYSVAPTHLAPLLPHKTDIYRHYGKSYVIEPMRMRGGGAALTALATGDIDIAGLGIKSFALAIVKAKLDGRLIADVMSNIPGWGVSYFWARKGEIKSLKELKGRTVAVNARGSSVDATIQKMMGDLGFKDGRDYKIVEVRFPAMIPALDSKLVDAAYFVGDFARKAEKSGKYDKLFSTIDALGPTQTVVWIANAAWLQKNRSAVVDFFEDYIRFLRWVMDPANHKEAIELTAKVTKRPAASYAGWAFTKQDSHRDLNARPDVKILQKNIDDLHKLGFLPARFDIDPKYVDLSLVDEAALRLKK